MSKLSGSSSLWQIIIKVSSIALVCLIVLFVTSCTLKQEKEYISEQFLMDTFIKIKIYSSDKDLAQRATRAAFAEFKRVALLTNRFTKESTSEIDKSDVIKINSKASKYPVKVSDDVLTMLTEAKRYYQLTNGNFDITISPIMDLWGFGKEQSIIPSEKNLNDKLKLVNSSKIIINLEESSVFLLDKNMALDLGAMAKGYATEKAAQVLKENGIEKAIIDAGGNIYALGEREKNISWKIGIQDPRNTGNIVGILKLKDEVAVTSGDYQRYFEKNGIRYHHLLNPKTGKPARDLISVTVIAKNSAIADILSTSFFIMGVEDSLELLSRMEDIGAVFITNKKKIIVSENIKDKVEIEAGKDYVYDKSR